MSEWQPIESAPKDGSWIAVTSNWNKYYRGAVQWNGEGWWDMREMDEDLTSATHWMPLPDPPSA